MHPEIVDERLGERLGERNTCSKCKKEFMSFPEHLDEDEQGRIVCPNCFNFHPIIHSEVRKNWSPVVYKFVGGLVEFPGIWGDIPKHKPVDPKVIFIRNVYNVSRVYKQGDIPLESAKLILKMCEENFKKSFIDVELFKKHLGKIYYSLSFALNNLLELRGLK